MKKRILLIVIASFMIMGAVSAASLWGEYKGNRIIRVTLNGTVVKPSIVPAINYNSKTMLPLDMLDSLGIKYKWDSKNQTVNLTKGDTFSMVNAIIVAKQYDDFFQLVNTCNNKSEVYAVGLLNANPISKDSLDECHNILKEFIKTVDDNLEKIPLPKSELAQLKKMSSDSNSILTKFSNQINYLYSTNLDLAEKMFVEVSNDTYTALNYSTDYVFNLLISLQKGEVPVPVVQEPVKDEPRFVPPVVVESDVIISKIDGTFEGFENEKIFKLLNGQIWEQTSYDYKYSYKYSPEVTIYQDGLTWYMIVDGVDGKVKVKKIK